CAGPTIAASSCSNNRPRGPSAMHIRTAAAVAAFLVGAVWCAGAQDAQQVKVTPLASARTTAIGQPITLPRQDVEVRAWLYEIAVGAVLEVHKHPFPRYAYVLAGTLRVFDKENARTFEYSAG